MKNIRNYQAEKYSSPLYQKAAPDIYAYGSDFVTSLCFEQEPELGEGSSAADISQYPLEDILDRYRVFVSDFYEDINVPEARICCLEFGGSTVERLRQLRSVIGKHVYSKESEGFAELIIEQEI